MAKSKLYLKTLFHNKGIIVSSKQSDLFEVFANDFTNNALIESIAQKEILLMEKWKIISRLNDIDDQQIIIPNGMVAKHYETIIDLGKLGLKDIEIDRIEGLSEIDLSFNKEENKIHGIPNQSGDLKLKCFFTLKNEESGTTLHAKTINLVINPDPKTLWKDLPSNTDDLFWKEDDVAEAEQLGDRNIVVASKRGRSHKNVGSFRDDDYSFKYFEDTGWTLVSVSDGAGSYSLSRKGSQIACSSLIQFFEGDSFKEKLPELEEKINKYSTSKDETSLKETEVFAKQILYKATVFVHNKIKEHAEITAAEMPELFNNSKAKSYLDYYHATLIFTLFRKYEFGYIILTFGVGDCPIAVMNKEEKETSLLNWLDVGEFGGGTRFITQPEIFHSAEHSMASRFNFKIIPDFSYLFLMSDGIYDPKFVVEANLEKNEKWFEFLEDLKGKNEDSSTVNFDKENPEIAQQLSVWMDFWSPGNHDDRTLAIVY